MSKRQDRIATYRLQKGFDRYSITDDLCFLHQDVAQAARAYITRQSDDNVSHALSEVCISCYGIASRLGIDLDKVIDDEIAMNEKTKYEFKNGEIVPVENNHKEDSFEEIEF